MNRASGWRRFFYCASYNK